MRADTRETAAEQGRSGERAQRQPARPIWAGMAGGRYRPLTDREVERIRVVSLDLLEQVGVARPTDEWRDRDVAGGSWINEAGRLCFSRGLVKDCIAPAEHDFAGCFPTRRLTEKENKR